MSVKRCAQGVECAEFDLRKHVENTRRLAIVTTDECQARCAHCLMESGPSETARLSLNQIITAVNYFIEHGNLQQLTFTGGESTLLGSELLEAIAHCANQGISTRLVTNVHWAKTRDEARDTLEDLREAGLDELNYSMDEFHAVWVPLENLKNAWLAAKGMGFSLVLVASCEGPRTKLTAQSIREYLREDIPIIENLEEDPSKLPKPAADGTRYVISRSNIARLGRGRRLRADYLSGGIDYSGYSRRIYGGCPGLFDPPTLNPDGTFGVCCGIRSKSNRILSVSPEQIYKREGHIEIPEFKQLILEALRLLGPTMLLRIASGKSSIVERNRIESPCEACEILTRSPAYMKSLRKESELLEKYIEAGSLMNQDTTSHR